MFHFADLLETNASSKGLFLSLHKSENTRNWENNNIINK